MTCTKYLLYFIAGILLLIFAPGIPPYEINFKTINVTKLPYKGALKPNDLIDQAQKLTTEIEGAPDLEFQVNN